MLTSEVKNQLVVADSVEVTKWRRDRAARLDSFNAECKQTLDSVAGELSQLLVSLEEEASHQA